MKKTTLFITLAVATLCSFFFTGNIHQTVNALPHDKENNISFTIANHSVRDNMQQHHDLLQIIRSNKELNQLRDKTQLNFDCLIAKYDDAFFEKQAIIVYMFTEPSISFERTITGLYRKNDTLTLLVERNNPSSMLRMMLYKTEVLEVCRFSVSGATNIKDQIRQM